jgi:hypothetical protein
VTKEETCMFCTGCFLFLGSQIKGKECHKFSNVYGKGLLGIPRYRGEDNLK